MRSKSFFNGNDTHYGANVLCGIGLQYFPCPDLRQVSDCLKVVIRNPSLNVRIFALLACQLDDRDNRISVPIKHAAFSIVSYEKGDGRERSLTDVSLMVEFLPKFGPDLCGIPLSFESPEQGSRIEQS